MAEFEIKDDNIIIGQPGSIQKLSLVSEAGQNLIQEFVDLANGSKDRFEIIEMLSKNGPIEI
jgi:hypothetical protein